MSWSFSFSQSDTLRQQLSDNFQGIPIFQSLDSIQNFIEIDTTFEYRLFLDSSINSSPSFEVYLWDKVDSMMLHGRVNYSDSSFHTIMTNAEKPKKTYRNLVNQYSRFFAKKEKNSGIFRDMMTGYYRGYFKETHYYLNENDEAPLIVISWVKGHTCFGRRKYASIKLLRQMQ